MRTELTRKSEAAVFLSQQRRHFAETSTCEHYSRWQFQTQKITGALRHPE